MLTTIRTQYTRIAAAGSSIYQRALRTIGITDCAEMRVTSAVAVCVVLYYLITLCAWVIDLIHPTATVTALITQ